MAVKAPKLAVTYMKLSDIKPYKRNAKKHPKAQIERIAESIREFGMNDPLGIAGPENEIVEGHGRYAACVLLGLDTVPVVRLDHLNEEQRKAYNLVHNQLNMETGFDLKLLSSELDDILNVDMGGFGFEVESVKEEWNERHDASVSEDRFRNSNILNLERAVFPGVGQYDVPELEPVIGLPEVKEWIRFDYVLSEKNPEGKGVHFFASDYKFARIWNNPEKYVDKLRRFACVATPDFSPYGDMPFCLQLYNHYRKHWVGAYLQQDGVTVIPTIRASTDPRSMSFYLDGEPEGGSVIISSMWTKSEQGRKVFIDEYRHMYDVLKPERVYLYGKMIDGLPGNITLLPTYQEAIFGKKGR